MILVLFCTLVFCLMLENFYHSGIMHVKVTTMQVTLLKTTCNLRYHNSIHTISTKNLIRSYLNEALPVFMKILICSLPNN